MIGSVDVQQGTSAAVVASRIYLCSTCIEAGVDEVK